MFYNNGEMMNKNKNKINNFGSFIKQRRLDLGLTIRDLASKLKISPTYLCDIENGNRIVPQKILNLLKKELQILPDEEIDFEDMLY